MTELFVSQVTHLEPRFKVKALPLALTLLSAALVMPAYALETISDSDMSDATAEGVAFLPENMSFRLNATDGTADTGYIRIIPVGPLTPAAIANTTNGTAGKGDVYLYGAAISESNQSLGSNITSADWNSRFGNTIDSWGEAKNPWLISVVEQSVPNFVGTSVNLPYINIEAPLYDSTLPASGTAASSAYNLKLGMWADIFVRDPGKVEGTANEFCLGGVTAAGAAGGCLRKTLSGDAGATLTRENRLRLQAIWNGFSVNGSNIKIFQTLDDGSAGVTTNSTYRTLGLSGLLRLNSGAAASTQAGTYTYVAGSRTVQPYTITWDGSRRAAAGTAPNWTDTSGVSGGALSTACSNVAASNTVGNACRVQYQTRATIDTASQSTWSLPTINSVLRISTRETTDTSVINTPALSATGTAAPIFDANEGLFLYNPNINIVLGQLYQPLILDVAPDNKNIVVEVAAVPNVPAVYKKMYSVYTDTDAADATYTGSTCNVYQCGAVSGAYQGSTATHSSISIGTTNWSGSTTNLLTADKSAGAIGISFGALSGSTTYSTAAQSYRDVQSATRATGAGAFSAFANLPVGQSALFNLAAYSPNTWTQQAPLAAPVFATPIQSYPMNNLGSAVIDGLLIQHLKLTTAGL